VGTGKEINPVKNFAHVEVKVALLSATDTFFPLPPLFFPFFFLKKNFFPSFFHHG